MSGRYGWTQPQCQDCWDERNPGREAVRVNYVEHHTCVTCSRPTAAGIFIRIDPAEAPHPTLTKELTEEA